MQEENMQPVKHVESCIEAVVFAAGYPVAYQKLADVTGVSVRDVKKAVARIAKKYEDEKHGIMMLIFEKTCQFCTKEQYADYIREALGIRRGGNLSGSSMEVLAIVAYNQPVTRAFIDAVRGVDSNYAVNSLIDKELIVATGRLDAPGRPLLYNTTDKFLRVFGLNTLEDLPETETITPATPTGDQLSIAMVEDEGEGEEESEEESESTAEDAETVEESAETPETVSENE